MKSRVIRVSPEVYEVIRGNAIALVDTPDSVLRRLLKLPPKPRSTRGRKGTFNELPYDPDLRYSPKDFNPPSNLSHACKAITGKGTRCTKSAQQGTDYCGHHYTSKGGK